MAGNDAKTPPSLLSSHGRLLLAVHQHPGLTQEEYGTRIGVTRRTIIRLLDDLEACGYLTTRQTKTVLDITINHDAKLPSGARLGDWLTGQL